MPRNTAVFGPTFRGEGVVRMDDVTRDPRFGKNAPYRGLPQGHLPVRSYLAVPVISRSGEVLGGIFFGHPQPSMFTEEHERLAVGVAGWTAVAIDNARLFRAAEAARASAETANRAKDEFLATMSHELRTPLNAVLGWTMILRSNGDDEVMRRRALDTIERNARAQAKIIEDLLDVSRIVSGKLILEPTAVNLVTAIESAVDGVRLAADTKRLAVRRRLDRTAAIVNGDPTRLQQVVSNLLTNAVKFTPAGGWIEVRLEGSDGMARLSVADNGQGINPEFLPHVFERFRQADGSTTRAHGGLGLGLAIVRHLVDLHGGTVHVASPGPGGGSTFTVEIPLMQAAPAETPAPSSLPDVGTMERPLDGVRVMVVDDDVDSRDLMTHLLERAGAAVTSLASAAAVLEKIDAVAPHVLISDIGMPGHDGYELLRLLRTLDSSCANVPAIAVTAYARPDDGVRAMEAGFQLHMPKPISPRDLIANVERLAVSDR
jgi:signal transduction histidine kinase/ActR/RegA family two-component response regulator